MMTKSIFPAGVADPAEPLPSDPQAPVEVFHGTWSGHFDAIKRDGLRPILHRGHVFVTRRRDRAVDYAKARAAERTVKETDPEDGLLVAMTLPAGRLENDPFNPYGEPDQYRVLGRVAACDLDLQVMELPELRNPDTLDHYRALAAALPQGTSD